MSRDRRGRGMLPGVMGLEAGTEIGTAILVSLAQTQPAFTQAAALAHTDRTVALAQTQPAFTQAVTVTTAGISARALLVTYLVMEVPDTPTYAAVTQTAPAFTQAGALELGLGGWIAQTQPAFTQAATATMMGPIRIVQTQPAFTQALVAVKSGLVATITQTQPAFTQAATGSSVGGTPPRATYTWRGPVMPRTWRGLRRRT